MKVFIALFALVALTVAEHVSEEVDVLDKAADILTTEVGQLENIPECLAAYKTCRAGAHSARERLMCAIALAKCAGGDIAKCAKTCVMPFIACVKDAGVEPMKKLMCFVQVAKCIATECRKSDEDEKVFDMASEYIRTEVTRVEGIPECFAAFKTCRAGAHSARDRLMCVVELAKCAGGDIARCAKACVIPFIACVKDSGDSPMRKMMCYISIVKCITTECRKDSLADVKAIVSTSPATYSALAEENECILEACKMMFGSCMREARGHPIRMIQCTAQFGICSTMTLVKCSRECIAPMLQCHIDAIGDWRASLKCCTEFIGCAIGGCSRANGMPAITSDEVLQAMDMAAHPDTINDCFKAEQACISGAQGPIAKIKCVVVAAKCLAGESVKCAKTCAPAFVTCVKDAGFDINKIVACSKDVITCIKKCKGDVVVEEALTAIESTIEDPEKLSDCVTALKTCMSEAEGFFAKISCITGLAKCIASEASACGQKCLPPFVECVRDAGFSISKVTQCAKDMVSCVSACKDDVDVVYEALSAIEETIEDPEKLSDCVTALKTCMSEAEGFFAKISCITGLAKCIASEASACGQKCLPPFVECVRDAGFSISKVTQCAKDMVSCVSACKDEEVEDVIDEAIAAFHETIVDPEGVQDCITAEAQCMAEATGYLGKIKCLANLAACIGREAAACGQKCLPPFVECVRDAGFDITKVMGCGKDMITCVQDCQKDDALALATVNDPNIDVLEGCKIMMGQCMSTARGNIVRVAMCVGQFGICSAMKLVGCSKECIPPMLMCHASSIGNWIATFKCCADFIKCAIGGCIHEFAYSAPAIAPAWDEAALFEADRKIVEEITAALAPTNDLIDECKNMYNECNGLADGKLQKLECFVQFGLCLGAKVVKCSEQCVTPLIECKLTALKNKDFVGFVQCSADFIKCAVGGCLHPDDETKVAIMEPYAPYQMAVDLAAFEEEDNGIIDVIKECQVGHHKCMESATSMGDKAKCFLQFGWCIARKLTGCAKSCIPGMAICLMGAHGDPIKTFMCATNFVRCVKHECSNPSFPQNPVMAIAETNDDIHEVIKKCTDGNTKCMAAADPGVKGKALCYVKYGYCIATGLARCSAGCLPRFAICSMRATGNWMSLLHCGMEFVTCAKDACGVAGMLLQ